MQSTSSICSPRLLMAFFLTSAPLLKCAGDEKMEIIRMRRMAPLLQNFLMAVVGRILIVITLDGERWWKTDPRVECLHQRNCFCIISQNPQQSIFSFRTSTKLQLQNLGQTPSQKLDLNLASKLTKPQIWNLDQNSAIKSWSNLSLRVSTKE